MATGTRVAPAVITKVFRTLRSVRRYRDDPVPEDVLRDVLEVARWCDSGKNRQTWHFVVVRDRVTLAALALLQEMASVARQRRPAAPRTGYGLG